MEEWKPIRNYESFYLISSLGRIKRDGRILKTPVTGVYRSVCLCKGGIRKPFRIHILVLQAFIGDRPKGYVSDHMNRNKLDNRIENLRYVTHKQNSLNSSILEKPENKKRFALRKSSIYLKEIRKDLYEQKLNQRQIAEKYKLHYSTISRWIGGSRRINLFKNISLFAGD